MNSRKTKNDKTYLSITEVSKKSGSSSIPKENYTENLKASKELMSEIMSWATLEA